MKKKTQSRRSLVRKLEMEWLAQRLLLAGNVAVDLSRGHLIVRGDELDNQIAIESVGKNHVRVTGLNGTTINGSLTPFVAKVRRGVDIAMRGGNDEVLVSNIRTRGRHAVQIDLGNGDDILNANSIRTRRLHVDGGAGNDTLNVNNSNVRRGTTLLGGEGNDRFSLSSSRLGSLNLDGGSGANQLSESGVLASSRSSRLGVQPPAASTSSNSQFNSTSTTPSDNAQNKTPSAQNDNATVTRGQSVAISVLDNDFDPDGSLNSNSIVIASQPQHGFVSIQNGRITYFHNGDSVGFDSFSYIVNDNLGLNSNVATVSVTIQNTAPSNVAPVANNDTAEVTINQTVQIQAWLNDFDSDGTLDGNSISIVTPPRHGQVSTVLGNGVVSYSHSGNNESSDSFTYTIRDNQGAISNIATVSISIRAPQQPPFAGNDFADTLRGESVIVLVAANDFAIGETLDQDSIQIVTPPRSGSVEVLSAGRIQYTHDGSNTTSDTFIYTIRNARGVVSNPATVTIGINSPNPSPTANNDSVTLNEGTLTLVFVLDNDSGNPSQINPQSVVIVTPPASGTTVVNSNGSVTYLHNGDESRTDSFIYRFSDQFGNNSNLATVFITITPVNDAPIASDREFDLMEGDSIEIVPAINDPDDLATVFEFTQPSHGTVTVDSQGRFVYTHDGSETTNDSFTFLARDTFGAVSNTATISLRILPVNDSPTANSIEAELAEGGVASIVPVISDPDDMATVFEFSQPSHGAVILDSQGRFVYTHDGSETTTDSFTFNARDASGMVSNTATISLRILPVNDAPAAGNREVELYTGRSIEIIPSFNDPDDLATVFEFTQPEHGTVVLTSEGRFVYTHDGSATSSDSFTFVARDTFGASSNVATITLTILQNVVPIASDQEVELDEGGTIEFSPVIIDSNDVATVFEFTQPSHGTVTVDGQGRFVYTHDGSETTSDSFTFLARDTFGAVSNTATISLRILPVNDAPVVNGDSAVVNEHDQVYIDLVQNDFDFDGTLDLESIVIVNGPEHGTLELLNDGRVLYFHDGSETLLDSFTYQIRDNVGLLSNVATVSLSITPVNDSPIALPDSASVLRGGTVNIPVLSNDYDVDSEPGMLTVEIASDPPSGSVTIEEDGSVTYTHLGNGATSDYFEYQIRDSLGLVSSIVRVDLTILEE
jgi:VCBS repeat-containing protein